MLRRIAAALLFTGILPVAPAFAAVSLNAPALNFEAAHRLLEQGKYASVLDYALDAVRRNPDSWQDLFLLGAALHRGEGNLPLAQRQLERARKIVEREGGYGMLSPLGRIVYVETLDELVWICGESEQYKEQLDVIDLARRETGRDWSYQSGWALMKLGRLKDARRLMEWYTLNPDPDVRATAMNTMGAIASDRGNLEASYVWFTKILDDDAARNMFGLSTLYSNRAETSLSLLHFSAAESDWLESSRHFSPSTYANPWSDLALLYAGEGKLPLAVDAARRMREWDRSTEASIEQQRWNLDARVIATLLMAIGHDRRALNVLDVVLRRPDRQGTTTSSPAEAEICLLSVYNEALRLNREHALEQMSWSGPGEWIASLWNSLRYSVEEFSARSRLRALVMKHKSLDWVLRPYTEDSTIPEWVRPATAGALGEGLSENRLRQLLADKSVPAREHPYLEESLGESLLRNGNTARGVELLSEALKQLPLEEPLLRARVHALLADTLARSGQMEAARAHYVSAFDLDPRVFRSLGLSVPVTVRTDDDKASRIAGSWLAGMRRFRSGNALYLNVRRTGDWLQASLVDRSGTVLGRADSKLTKSPKESARLLCEKAAATLFAARINAEQADLGSLDGSMASGVAIP